MLLLVFGSRHLYCSHCLAGGALSIIYIYRPRALMRSVSSRQFVSIVEGVAQPQSFTLPSRISDHLWIPELALWRAFGWLVCCHPFKLCPVAASGTAQRTNALAPINVMNSTFGYSSQSFLAPGKGLVFLTLKVASHKSTFTINIFLTVTIPFHLPPF